MHVVHTFATCMQHLVGLNIWARPPNVRKTSSILKKIAKPTFNVDATKSRSVMPNLLYFKLFHVSSLLWWSCHIPVNHTFWSRRRRRRVLVRKTFRRRLPNVFEKSRRLANVWRTSWWRDVMETWRRRRVKSWWRCPNVLKTFSK